MSASLVIHEFLMNRSGTIQPRVGVGVRGGVGVGLRVPSKTNPPNSPWRLARPAQFGFGAAR